MKEEFKMAMNKQGIGVSLLCLMLISSAAMASGWAWEGAADWNNDLATPAAGTTYSFDIGNAASTWYWSNAGNIQFDNGGGTAMRWYDINGGSPKLFTMKFEFSQAITSFQFTTPSVGVTMQPLTWSAGADGAALTSIWTKPGTTAWTSYGPEAATTLTFDPADNVTRIWLQFTSGPGYCSQMTFYDSADDGGVITVTTVPEPMTLALLATGALAMLRRRAA
jgi:hypothetical protein